jgi:hypothetical protein
MKSRIQFPIFLALFAVVLWAGCNNSATSTGSGDKVTLERNVTIGQVYKQVTRTDQKIEQKMMGMAIKTSSVQEMYMRNEVIGLTPEGVATTKTTYERVKTETDNSQTGKSTFDSQNQTGEVPLQNKGMMALIGKSLEFDIDKRGTVLAVRGIDALMDAIMGSMGEAGAGPQMETMKSALKATFGDEAMKSMMQSGSIQFPDVLIAEGDTWGKQFGAMGSFPIKIDVTYKVDHIDGDKVVLSFEGNITSDKGKALDLGIVSMNMDLTGKYSGTSEVDRKTGLVLKSTIEQSMTGNMSTMGMTVPMNIDQTVTVGPY